MNIKIYQDRYTETCNTAGTQFEQNATVIKFDFSELDFIDDECIKTIHFFHDSLEEANYIGDSIIQNDEFKIPKSITKYENVLAFVQITKEDFIWKTKSFNLDFYKSLDVDKTLDEDQLGILQELILEVQQIKTDTADEYKQLAEEETKKFNDNATAKTNTFNSNAISKETSYNENATAKLNEYNENHTSKIDAYNENAQDKIEEYDEHIEDLDNIVSKNIASGESIYIDDALKYKIFDCKIDGNAKQTTTTGKNYFNAYAIKNPNIIVEDNGQTIKMPLVSSGNGVQNTKSTLAELCPNLTVGDKVTLIFNRNLGTTNNAFIYLSAPISSVWIINTSKTITEEMLDCEVQLYGNRYIDGETEQCIITDFTIMKSSETDTTFEPFTNNEPSPNPDYPQEISIVSDEVKIVQTGKNSFDKNGDFTYGNNNNLTSLQEDGTIKTTSNFSNNRSAGQLISVDPNTNYTVSGVLLEAQSPNNVVVEILSESNNRIYIFEISGSDLNHEFSFSFNSADNEKIWISLNARDFNLSAGVYAIFDKIQIEEGPVATEYEEYKSNEYTIDLQNNELVKLTDDIKDTIEIDKNRNVSLNKRIGKAVLDENTNPTIASQNYPNLFFFSLSALGMNVNSLKAISDYFTFVDDTRITDNASANTYLEYGQFAFRHGTVDRIYFKIENITTGTDFKTWLADHNVTVYYELAEPTKSNLNQLTNFKTYAGVNHFFLETNLATSFEIKYVQDLQKVISKQQEEIDELKTLLSSTATSALLLDNYESDLINEIESEV